MSKYFGIFVVMSLLTLLYGFEVMTQSHKNIQHELVNQQSDVTFPQKHRLPDKIAQQEGPGYY